MIDVDGLLIDIDGVLTVSWQPIDGALDAFAELRRRGVPLRLATNTTTRTRREIAFLLQQAGFEVEVADILTAPVATAAYIRSHHSGAGCFLLSSGDVAADLEGIRIVEDDEPAEVVVLGGAGLVYTHEQLNRAFGLLLDGAAFIAMHRNLYWRTSRGLELDTGAYVLALEAASGVKPVVVGKPAQSFFQAGLDALGMPSPRVAMIGDDIVNDVLGAQAVGLQGVLVRTGKYRRESAEAANGTPDVTLAAFADLPQLLSS